MKALITPIKHSAPPSNMVPSNNLVLPKPLASHVQSRYLNDENSNMGRNQSPLTIKDSGMGVLLDHSYARPLNWRPESSFYQPTKLLFIPNQGVKRKFLHPLAPHQDFEEEIDIDFVPPAGPELYDKDKAVALMEECDRYVEVDKAYDPNDDWEESIKKTNWSDIQHRLYDKVAAILTNDQLARLSKVGSHYEPVERRITIDKSVKRMRHVFAGISWDLRLTQWIHQLLLDHLSPTYLSAYLDILQTLKSKLPGFVDKMMFGPNSTSRIGPTSVENMFQLLKRPWDPFSAYLPNSKLNRLPGNPIFIIVPAAPSTPNSHFKRHQKWISLFSNLATVVAVHTNIGLNANRLTMISCADQLLSATRAKVQEIKADYSGRTIILVGFNAGSALALQVAQVESVTCVICMGFSVLTAEGKRGDPDDSLLELQCPVLFVIGQCSNTSSQEDVEDLRERMRIENGLIVVGSADDCLRVNKKKKRAEGITQSAVDLSIVESVGEFLNALMISPYPPQVRQSPVKVANEPPNTKRLKMERVRNNSNGSSLESEPPSPTPKVTRPVGRPPGSKSKNKLEAKWAAQIAQGILPSPSSTQPTSKSHNLSPKLSTSELPLSDSNSKLPSAASHNETCSDKDLISDVSECSSNSKKEESSAAKLQMMGLNRSILTASSTIPNIVSNKISISSAQKHSSGIKVLENISFNPAANPKPMPVSKHVTDLSKVTLLNSLNAASKTGMGNVVLMPDGKLKTFCSSVKGTSSTPLILPMAAHRTKPGISQMPPSIKSGLTKYITSKKQLMGRKLPYPSQKLIPTYTPNLPPPANLTSQDIMDLPIIFADDNQMLTENAELQEADVAVPEIIQPIQPQKLIVSNPVGKYVYVNKQQQPLLQSVPTPALKRPTLSVPVRTTSNPVKYTKIILSRGFTNDTKASTSTTNTLTNIPQISPEVSIRRIENSTSLSGSTSDMVDLENKLVATAIPKPEYTITVKKEQDCETSVVKMEKSIEIIKRNVMASTFNNPEDDDDPDYIPPKSSKLK